MQLWITDYQNNTFMVHHEVRYMHACTHLIVASANYPHNFPLVFNYMYIHHITLSINNVLKISSSYIDYDSEYLHIVYYLSILHPKWVWAMSRRWVQWSGCPSWGGWGEGRDSWSPANSCSADWTLLSEVQRWSCGGGGKMDIRLSRWAQCRVRLYVGWVLILEVKLLFSCFIY